MDSHVIITEERPALESYEDVASRLEHMLLRPEMSEEEVSEGCHTALRYGIASVIVRPSDIDMAVRILGDSPVKPASVAGFPHGSSSTATKLYEGRDLLRRGAREIGIVVNISKMVARQFQYVEMELLQMSKSCHESGATLKVIFENAWLTDEMRIILSKICKRVETDYAETSTGFGPSGYTLPDLALMKSICRDVVQLKATGGVDTLEQVTELYGAGCERMGSTETFRILDSWKAILAEREAARKQQTAVSE